MRKSGARGMSRRKRLTSSTQNWRESRPSNANCILSASPSGLPYAVQRPGCVALRSRQRADNSSPDSGPWRARLQAPKGADPDRPEGIFCERENVSRVVEDGDDPRLCVNGGVRGAHERRAGRHTASDKHLHVDAVGNLASQTASKMFMLPPSK